MSACEISFSFSFVACAGGLWDWLMTFIPGGFPSLTFIAGLVLGSLLGPKALAIALVVIGFLLGRRSVGTDEQYPDPDAVTKRDTKPRKKRPF